MAKPIFRRSRQSQKNLGTSEDMAGYDDIVDNSCQNGDEIPLWVVIDETGQTYEESLRANMAAIRKRTLVELLTRIVPSDDLF